MYKYECKYEYYPKQKQSFYLKSKKNKVMDFHGSDKKWNFFGTLLWTNVNIILNKNKTFIRKIKENEVDKDIAFQRMI